MQLPFLRCLIMGRASVAAFAILSGYVNALKPTRQARTGQIDAMLAGVAKSAFRRTGRFIIPALLATTGSWLLCQFGVYNLGRVVDSHWVRDTSPRPSGSLPGALYDLFHALLTTWTNGANQYDRIQWTLTFLLRGSMLVYLALFATAYVSPRYRIWVYAGMFCYYWALGDGEPGRLSHSLFSSTLGGLWTTNADIVIRGTAVIGINIYAGLIMSELTHSPEVTEYVEARPVSFSVLSTSMIFAGLLAISFPEEHPEWAAWSRAMLRLGGYLFPHGAEFARFYPGLGAQLICLGVLLNGPAKRALSAAWPCFLGRVSFAIYLLHAPLLRTVLVWMLYGLSRRPPSPGKDEQGHPLPQPWVPLLSKWALVICIPVWYVLLYRLAALWVAHVEPFCGRVTNWIEERIFRDDSRVEKPISQA